MMGVFSGRGMPSGYNLSTVASERPWKLPRNVRALHTATILDGYVIGGFIPMGQPTLFYLGSPGVHLWPVNRVWVGLPLHHGLEPH